MACRCGRDGQKLVEGVTLYVRRPDHPTDLTSTMTIRLGDEAVRSIKADLGLDPRCAIKAQGFVKIASEGLLIFLVDFRSNEPSDIGYYLARLRLHRRVALHDPLPAESAPRGLLHVGARRPVLRRIDGGSDPQLVLTAHGA